ncbi:MAG: hypothetical protein H0T75_09895 [Rhizobiales bacterium]|nr:hypothetical protein [Hyphomicrobiales bacterium]MDQ3557903.1 hypothetical protein [Pseudomonadota bacterium]
MPDFDYTASAGVFTRTRRGSRGTGAKYRRFETAAEAIRYIIEELPAPLWPGITMEVNERTFDHREILHLYDSTLFPLERHP